jgi:hypothetical protein
VTRALNIRFPSDEEMQQPRVHARGGCNRKMTNPLQMVVNPIRCIERIKQLCTVGESIRQIAREEARGHAEALRMAQSCATQQYIEEVRMQLHGLLANAVESIRHTLDSEKGGKLAHRLLADLGEIQQRV